MFTVIIPSAVLDRIGERILKTPDVESCGFLVGQTGADRVSVARSVSATNISTFPDTYAISPREEFKIRSKLSVEESLVGVFHSHCRAPQPSRADLRTMELYPSLVWLIIGNTAGRSLSALSYAGFKFQGQLPWETTLILI